MGKGPETPPPTAAETAAAEVAGNMWNDAQTRYVASGFARNVHADVTGNFGNEERIRNVQEREQRKAIADAAIPSVTRMPGGTDPSQNGQALDAAATSAINVTSKAKTAIDAGVREGVAGGLTSAVQDLRGQKIDAANSMTNIAANSVNKALAEEKAKRQTDTTMGNAVGSVVGGGAGMYANAKAKDAALTQAVHDDITSQGGAIDFNQPNYLNVNQPAMRPQYRIY